MILSISISITKSSPLLDFWTNSISVIENDIDAIHNKIASVCKHTSQRQRERLLRRFASRNDKVKKFELSMTR